MTPHRGKRRSQRAAVNRPERQQDPRLVATPAAAVDGQPVAPDTWIVAVSPVRMDDGRMLNWHPPQSVAFNLVEAKRHCDRSVSRRRSILGNLHARANDSYGPSNSQALLDCVADLVAAVLFAFTAIESVANHSVDELPEDATVIVERGKRRVEIAKPEMVRRLSVTEKLTLVVPMLPDGAAFKGTHPWERYVYLRGLRDDLVHVDQRGYSPDPDVRTAYDRVVLGDADSCADDALAIVLAARPTFLQDHVMRALSPPS